MIERQTGEQCLDKTQSVFDIPAFSSPESQHLHDLFHGLPPAIWHKERHLFEPSCGKEDECTSCAGSQHQPRAMVPIEKSLLLQNFC